MQTIKQVPTTQQMITSLEFDVEQLINNVKQTQQKNSSQLGLYYSMFTLSSFYKVIKYADKQYFSKFDAELNNIQKIFKTYKKDFIKRQSKQFIFQDEPFIKVIERVTSCQTLVKKYQILIDENLNSFSKHQRTQAQFLIKHLQQAVLSLCNIRLRTQQLQKHQKQNYYRKIQNQSQKDVLGYPRIYPKTFDLGKQTQTQSQLQILLRNQSQNVVELLKENIFLGEKVKLLQKQNKQLKNEISDQKSFTQSLKKQIQSIKKVKNQLLCRIEDLQYEQQKTMNSFKNKQPSCQDPKTKQEEVQKYLNELAKKQELIKALKAQNQKSSIELNKKIKFEKDKFQAMKKQYDQKIEELQLNLQIAIQKIQRMSKQLLNSKHSHDKLSLELSELTKQNALLKQLLEEKQPFSNTTQQNSVTNKNYQNPSIIQISNKDETIVILHKQLNESNQKIQELQQQLTKIKSVSTNSSELQQKVNQLNLQNKVLQKKIFAYILKINSLETQLATTRGNTKL